MAMLRMRNAREAVAAAALVGCGAALPHIESTPPGQTDLVLEPHFEAPFSLRRARLAMDGEILYERLLDADAPASMLAFRGPLASGPHFLEAELDVVVDCGVSGALRAAYTIRSVRSFEVAPPDRGGGSLTLDLHTRGTMRDFGQRLELTYRAGGTLNEHGIEILPRRYRYPERCRDLAPVTRALCRAEADAADARTDRDVVRLLCTTEKLREMREVHDDDAKLIELGREADDCIGQDVGHIDNSIVARSTCPDIGDR